MIFVTKIITFSFGSSFPAKANRSVVFPELGGPKSNVILKNKKRKNRVILVLQRDINDNNTTSVPARLYFSTNILENV